MELVFDNRMEQVDFEGPVTDLLKNRKISREEVVIKVNGKLAPETRIVGEKDKVEIIKVVFGG